MRVAAGRAIFLGIVESVDECELDAAQERDMPFIRIRVGDVREAVIDAEAH